MPVVLPPFQDRLSQAVAQHWRTLEAQTHKQKVGVDHGRRGAVTGGKQMDGFCDLVDWVLRQNGLGEASIYVRSGREIPGFFRPTKEWDMLVVHEGCIVAALGFTSRRVPSLANDADVRIEETIGMAADMWTSFREGAYDGARPRPWLGWVMLFEDRSVLKSRASGSQFPGDPYGRRYEQILRKFKHERLYDSAALLASSGKGGAQGDFFEPAEDLTMKRLLASLVGYVGGYLAEVRLRPSPSAGGLPSPFQKGRAAVGGFRRARAAAQIDYLAG